MTALPLIPNLVQDISQVLYDNMCGIARYRMSMVSNEWHQFCTSRIGTILSKHDLKDAVLSLDILRILKNMRFIVKKSLVRLAYIKGNMDLINILGRQKIIDWRSAMYGACYSGNHKLIQFVLSNIPKPNNNVDRDGLWGACDGGHLDIATMMHDNTPQTHTWDTYFRGACKGCHIDLCTFIIEKSPYVLNLNGGLEAAYVLNLNGGLEAAYENGNSEIIQFVLALFVKRIQPVNWNYALSGACAGGHTTLIQTVIDKGVDRWNWGLINACHNGHIDIARLMIQKGAWIFNQGLRNACFMGHLDIVHLMLEHGATDTNDGLNEACLGGNITIARLMIKSGATVCTHCSKPLTEH